ncbi:hypothetical protein GWK47_023021 [Chionoecetes opilio]|uniref:Uncharacterized protein n=1 Tax=Chionoecetes opilio TaxID=41210 RepID=A0A8J5CF04_CHIOP|nr:hypothetical protein GWK47_023021 [Chionoecetes opilio]
MTPRSLLIFLLTATLTGATNVALFWNLYDAVVSGGRILHDVAEGVGAVSKAIRAIDNFLDTSALTQVTEALSKVEETKDKQEGTMEGLDPDPGPSEVPIPGSFSGCGALGLHIRDDSLPLSTMTECCGVHDACYAASCRANKKECDGKLRSCLYAACDGRGLDKLMPKNCKGAAKLLFSGTMALSFQQFNSAQVKLGCRTSPQKSWKKG